MQKEELVQFLQKYHLRPEKKLGQHYLVDELILAEIIRAAGIQRNELVLEIGAGPGILTKALAQAGAEILAVEFDRDFCRLLNDEFHNWRNVHVLCEDALRLDFSQLQKTDPSSFRADSREIPNQTGSLVDTRDDRTEHSSRSSDNYQKIVANIPYQITNPLIRKILEPGSLIDTAVLLIQKEVADRLMAEPGNSERGILTIMVEMYGTIEKVVDVPASSFWPAPKVESTVIKITRIKNRESSIKTSDEGDPRSGAAAGLPRARSGRTDRQVEDDRERIKDDDEQAFFWLVKQGFSGKRKILINSLSGSLRLPKAEAEVLVKKARIDELARAEDLSLEQWLKLFELYKEQVGEQ